MMVSQQCTFFRISLLIVFLILTGIFTLSAQNIPDARSLYEEGLESLESDNPYNAVDSFRSAIRLNPSYAEARLGMAEALFLLGEYDEAAREIEEARHYASGRRDLILLEARILTALMQYQEAADMYQALLDERPHDGDANRGLGEIYALIGQKDLAEDAYSLSLRYSPGDQRVLLQLVLLHDESREKRLAEGALDEALRRYPNNLEVRIRAAEHFAFYDQWPEAVDHLDRARSMVNSDDSRYHRIGLLDARFSILRGDAAKALSILETIEGQDEKEVLYLMARAHRTLGNEEQAQKMAGRILKIDPEDEITRLFREESLFLSATGYEEDRIEAAQWHLERGAEQEEAFYYRRAYQEYRRAKLIAKDNPEVWIAYVDLIRKMGYPELYADSLMVAIGDIPADRTEHSSLRRKLELLEHSSSSSLSEEWDIPDPWLLNDPESEFSAEWNLGVYFDRHSSMLPIHGESQSTLALYFADLLDAHPDMSVSRAGETRLTATEVTSFPEAFRLSRGKEDYFIMMSFIETNRSFRASCELYLSRTGERVGRFDELRTGQGRVTDTLQALSDLTTAGIPKLMRIVGLDGNRALLNKGRWHGIDDEESWIVIRDGGARPASTEGGLEYLREDFLGSLEIVKIDEPISEALYEKSGKFDFIRSGDMAFLLPVPDETDDGITAPDSAFRANLLAVP